jgi:hypothetical protein
MCRTADPDSSSGDQVTARLKWAAEDDPIGRRLIFVSATAGQREQRELVAAWELYQGGCLPELRQRLADYPEHRGRVRLISAEYGLLHPHTMVPPSRRLMTEERAAQLRPRARAVLLDEAVRYGVPREVVMVTEHPYHLVVTGIYRIAGTLPHTSLFTVRPDEAWPKVAAVLDDWDGPDPARRRPTYGRLTSPHPMSLMKGALAS